MSLNRPTSSGRATVVRVLRSKPNAWQDDARHGAETMLERLLAVAELEPDPWPAARRPADDAQDALA